MFCKWTPSVGDLKKYEQKEVNGTNKVKMELYSQNSVTVNMAINRIINRKIQIGIYRHKQKENKYEKKIY